MKNLIRSPLKNIKNEWVIFNWENTQNYWSIYVHNWKKIFFLLYIKIVLKITKETWENNGIEVIVDSFNTLRLNEKHIEEQLGHKNLQVITNKHDKICKKADMN